MFDLLKAYGEIRSQASIRNVQMVQPLVMALEDARRRLSRAIGTSEEWLSLEDLLPPTMFKGEREVPRASIVASSLLASLELAKEGRLDIRQSGGKFSPIYIRAKTPAEKAAAKAASQGDENE